MKNRIIQVCVLTLSVTILFFSWYLLTEPAIHPSTDENGIFHIASKEDMAWFYYYLENGNDTLDAVLDADINMEEVTTPYIPSYDGHFDGQGHTISNSKDVLFDRLWTNAFVENISLSNLNIQYVTVGIGGIAYRNYGYIKNCQVSGRIEGVHYVGGIVSENFGIIDSCTNYADIISTELYADEYLFDGCGAGGIAGISGTSPYLIQSKQNAVISCDNYGSVTARTLAGGICAYVDDRSNSDAANLSVQELVKTTDFAVYNPDSASPHEEEAEEDQDKPVNHQKHVADITQYSLIECKNYGTVTVTQMLNMGSRYTDVAGICGNLHYGDIYRCANLGNVMIQKDTYQASEIDYIYSNKPYAITDTMGLSPSLHHVIDCVNLKGTMPDSMWCENVMEVTQEELVLWEQGKLPYISNNWIFELEEAVSLCSLEPLAIQKISPSTGLKNIYQCEDFTLSLPKGFIIEEQYIGNVSYALRISISPESFKDLPYALQKAECMDYEAYLLRKEIDIEKCIAAVEAYPNKMEGMDHLYFIEEVYNAIPNFWILSIDRINLPFHANVTQKQYEGERNFMEEAMPFSKVESFVKEGDHVLGNVLSMSLEENANEELEAKWLFVFTNNKTNIRPDLYFITTIEEGFYPIHGEKK